MSDLSRVLFASAQRIDENSTEFIYKNGENDVTVFPRKLLIMLNDYIFFVYFLQEVFHLME